ncbi:flagellar basal-body rod protein FlgF [Tuberibacillus sp. Marseille-P3662]|uniref:flagellar basal-body rod protein FlgF n=1 Tax=Tuberibacillus sp. Marseille-P3662 TaxID=1965358 RepID=UPI000A1CC274|nr:flagellar basal-body rod protein FlgF [Tuberibacillus sp. Marseille-P3662]
MLRSMYSAIGGLKNFQTKLDVIGNNIANVNTYGYKKGRVTFKDLVSQQISGASAPTFDRGGVNPKQVGLGSTMGSIDNLQTQGSLQTTGRNLDLAISGDGFFQVNDGNQSYYTRAGNFYLDSNGNLVNSEGMQVQGYQINPETGNLNNESSALQINDTSIHKPSTDSIQLAGNFDASKLNDSGDNLSTEMTVIDENGAQHTAHLNVQVPGNEALGTNDDGDEYLKKLNFNLSSQGDEVTPDPAGTITLNKDGSVKSVDIPGGNQSFDINISGTSMNINEENLNFDGLTVRNQPTTADVIGDVPKVNSFSIGSSGNINAVLTNGDVQTVGQVQMYKFNNPGGLEKAGGNLYKNTSNSGEPILATAGGDGGSIVAGALEMSNVDLANEFTEMITAQRGFQANARVISTSDKVLQELVNLKR